MYLFIFDDFSSLHVIRNVPEDIENIEKFISEELGFNLDEIDYRIVYEDDVIYYLTYTDNGLTDDGVDYIGQKF